MKAYRLCLVFKDNKILTEEEMKEKFFKKKEEAKRNNKLKEYSEEKRKISFYPQKDNLAEEFFYFEEIKN